MKKKVLAVLLAVCMIVGTCVLFASGVTSDGKAETYAADKSTFKILQNDKDKTGYGFIGTEYKDLPSLEQATSAQSYTVKAKSKPEMTASADKVTADNILELVEFTPALKASEIEAMFDISNTDFVVNSSSKTESTTITLTVKDEYRKMYKLNKALADGDDGAGNVTDNSKEKVKTGDFDVVDWIKIHNAVSHPITVTDIERVDKLNNMNVGLRFFGEKYDNLVASELAIVKAFIDRDSNNAPPATPGVGDYTTYANTIYDLSLADTVYLYTKLKDPAQDGKYYKFYAWVDANGKILQKAGATNSEGWYGASFPADSGAVYAAYVETADRVTITYSAEGEGSINMFSDDREIAKLGGNKAGDNMVSVMKGRDVTVTFVPKEGWEVGKVIVDGTNITSFANIDFTSATTLARTIRAIIDATYKDTIGGQQASGSYTFYNIQDPLTGNQSHTIKVVFVKSNPLEAPSGKELPTIEAEGLTLATGAAAENAEGGAAGGAAGEGANGGAAGGTTLPAENGAAAGGSAVSGVVNPATGSTGTIAVFAVLSVAACAAFVTAKKKED